MSNSDDPNMCKVIQSLNGTPDANSPNEAMSHDGRTITDIKSKANIFINHYARVSKLNMSHIDRDINQQFKKGISAPSADNKSCAPLEMSELLSAIKKMKGKRAAGPDNIPPSFLKSLGPLALQELLSTPGVTTVKTRGRTFASSLEEEAAAMESALPGHLPTPTILQSPYFFAKIVSPCVKLSFHPILEHSQFTIPSTPYRLPSSFNGSLAILPFQVTI